MFTHSFEYSLTEVLKNISIVDPFGVYFVLHASCSDLDGNVHVVCDVAFLSSCFSSDDMKKPLERQTMQQIDQ